MSAADDGTVRLEHGATRNMNTSRGGWVPQVWRNGRATLSTWCARSLDLDVARERAAAVAREEAARYVGDWTITIRAVAP